MWSLGCLSSSAWMGMRIIDLPSLPSPPSRLEYRPEESQLTVNLLKSSLSCTGHWPMQAPIDWLFSSLLLAFFFLSLYIYLLTYLFITIIIFK